MHQVLDLLRPHRCTKNRTHAKNQAKKQCAQFSLDGQLVLRRAGFRARRSRTKRSRPHRPGRCEWAASHHSRCVGSTSGHHEFSGSYATGGAREVNSERQGNGCTVRLSASGRVGTATRATKKRKSGTRRMQNTPPAGVSAVNSTTVRHSNATDLLGENIILLERIQGKVAGLQKRWEKIERAVTLVML